MKEKLLVSGLILVLLLCGCMGNIPVAEQVLDTEGEESSSPTEGTDVVLNHQIPESKLFDIPWDDRSIFSANLISKAQGWVERLSDASQYRIELTIPKGMEVLTGKQEVLYTNREDVMLEEIVFRLFPNVAGGSARVENMRINGEPAEIVYESADSTVKVKLREPLQPGEKLLFELDFELGVPSEMGGNFGLFGFFENILVLDLFYPTIPVYDHNGWYEEPPSVNGDLSFYDASYYVVRVIAPADQVLVASGVEVAREEEDGLQTVVYANGPARDFSLVSSKVFTLLSDKVGEVQVNSYALPGFESAQEWALKVGLGAIKVFNERIGQYEYTEFDIVPTPMLAGGVEYPGMTWINMDYYDLGETFYGLPASAMMESTIAHEVGHHWFYNVVGNSQVSEAWLDESLVQYVTGLYFMDMYGLNAYESFKGSWDYRVGKMEDKDSPIGLASAEYEGYNYVGAVYGRGPFFFEEVNLQIGDEAFNAFLRTYADKYHWDIATGEGLKETLEASCDCNLKKLFKQWVYP